MSNTGIKNLFRNNRLPESDSSLLVFILYLPFGICIVFIRSILLCFLYLIHHILPESPGIQKLCNKIACIGLGISVNWDKSKVDENVEAYVSNSISIFDHLAVSNAVGSVSPTYTNTFEKVLKNSSYNFGKLGNLEHFKKNLSKFLSEKKTPLYFTPEGKNTNGKALLKFKKYPFEVTNKIQPICIYIERPIIDIAVSTLGSNFVTDTFYFMFCPITNYKLHFVASLEKKSISAEDFSEIARQNLASALQVELTDFTSNDLMEWEKKQITERKQKALARPTRSINTDLHRMSMQVKEVLPHVPLNAIYNDLCITRSVDNTITNILEGRLHFVPEVPSTSKSTTNQPSTSSGSSTSASDSSNSSLFKTAATSFPKSASERSKSFQERKEQLIANARKRYIEKHNLKVTI